MRRSTLSAHRGSSTLDSSAPSPLLLSSIATHTRSTSQRICASIGYSTSLFLHHCDNHSTDIIPQAGLLLSMSQRMTSSTSNPSSTSGKARRVDSSRSDGWDGRRLRRHGSWRRSWRHILSSNGDGLNTKDQLNTLRSALRQQHREVERADSPSRTTRKRRTRHYPTRDRL